MDLGVLTGTGPNGRIVESDVRDYLERSPVAFEPRPPVPPAMAPRDLVPAAGDVNRKLSRMRQTIARRLTESKQTVPHIYLTSDIDMLEAKALIAQLKAVEVEGRPRPTLTDLIVKACALALGKYPDVRSQFTGDSTRTPGSIDIGIAVSIPDGLIVPVIRNLESKTLHGVAAATRPLVERARAGKLTPDEYSGGGFTISNLGMYDVESFCAIINPPESAILAVASILDQVVAVDGQVAVRPRMKVTLSADHRVVDGVLAAQFLQEVKRLLQTPLALLD